MPFTIACPNCDAKLKATETLVGKTVKCPRCSKAVPIQRPSSSAASATPRLELPPSTEEPEVRTDFEDEDDSEPNRAVKDWPEEVDDLPEVDDEEVEEADFDEAMPADDDDDSQRRRKKKRRRPGAVTPEERQMAMFIYLLGLFTHFIGPIILWMMKREESKFIDHHGKEVINFSITMALGGLILGAVGVPLIFLTLCLGAIVIIPLMMAFGIYGTVMTIIGATKANKGEWWEFPISIRLIRVSAGGLP